MSKKKPNKQFINTIGIIILLFIILFLLIFLVPIIINESYKANTGYITLWDARDVLSFYSVILSGIITFVALYITIRHNNKNIEKQNILNLSQIKQPFFTIKNVDQYGGKTCFKCDDYGNWCKKIEIGDSFKISESDLNPIVIEIINIGDGIALSSKYSVSMFATNLSLENIINGGNISTILYNFELNLNDQFVNPIITSNTKEGTVVFNTYIKLEYCNTMGVRYQQTIEVNIERNFSESFLSVIIKEISPQTIDTKSLHYNN